MEEIESLGHEKVGAGRPTMAVHLAVGLTLRSKTSTPDHEFAALVSSDFVILIDVGF